MAHPEVEFARGNSIDTQQLEVTYTNLNALHPDARFPTIRKFQNNGTVTELGLTPEEGKWLAKVLVRMFANDVVPALDKSEWSGCCC
jgi:hypothetical protein